MRRFLYYIPHELKHSTPFPLLPLSLHSPLSFHPDPFVPHHRYRPQPDRISLTSHHPDISSTPPAPARHPLIAFDRGRASMRSPSGQQEHQAQDCGQTFHPLAQRDRCGTRACHRPRRRHRAPARKGECHDGGQRHPSRHGNALADAASEARGLSQGGSSLGLMRMSAGYYHHAGPALKRAFDESGALTLEQQVAIVSTTGR